MRRLLLLATAAAALATGTPADAAFACHRVTGTIEVCYQLSNCPDVCFIDPAVDPRCQQIRPPQPGCREIDSIYIRPFPSP